jgi:MFS family permease
MNHPSPQKRTPIPARNWFVIAVLSLSGQIAWGVENAWFNTFVFDTLTPNPRPIAWMVAISAITATVTTLLMGTLSDRTKTRFGRRRPYILFGYIVWGVITAAFPAVSLLRPIGVAVFLVITADAIMTFFGSTANDAAFNAWVTDITDTTNRGRVEGLLSMASFVSFIITFALAGIVIEQYGYFVFFYGLGGFVAITGLIGGLILKDAPLTEEEQTTQRTAYWKEIRQVFSLNIIKENKILFLLFIGIVINSIAWQTTFPYLLIYIEHFLGFGKSEYGLIMGAVLIVTALSTIPIGMVVDRVDRRRFIIWMAFLASVTALLFSFARGMVVVLVFGVLMTVNMAAFGIVSNAWLKDLYPKQNRGQFQGVRLFFWVMIPMIIGPAIGSFLISNFGIPTTMNGEAGFIPTPAIYYAATIINLFAILPLLRIPKKLKTSPSQEVTNDNITS